MSGTGTSSRTRALPYSCMRAAFMSASFAALVRKMVSSDADVSGTVSPWLANVVMASPVAGLTPLYDKAFLLTKGGSAGRFSWDGVFTAPSAHFVPCLPGSSLWMAALGGQVRLLQPR